MNHEDSLYDHSSVLIAGRLYFGSYPTRSRLRQIELDQFTHIIDLTEDGEMEPYDTYLTVIRFPVKDHSAPEDSIHYCHFVTHIVSLLRQPSTKLYIHCRGGHGRSSMLCVSIWMSMDEDCHFSDAVDLVNRAHSARVRLRDKWRYRRMPFNHIQNTFLHKMHKNIYLNIAECNFSNAFAWILPPRPYHIEHLYDTMKCGGSTMKEIEHAISERLEQRLSGNRDYMIRFQLTFLKSFKFVGVDIELDRLVKRVLQRLRVKFFYRQ